MQKFNVEFNKNLKNRKRKMFKIDGDSGGGGGRGGGERKGGFLRPLNCSLANVMNNWPRCREGLWGLLFTPRSLLAPLETPFYRFLARFSGRRRPTISSYLKKHPPSWNCIILYLVVLVSSFVNVTEACSSRSTPKPRPPVPTARPNITFLTYECPPAYAAWFCLNGATCFTVKIGDSLLYNCLCSDGYQGSRCEYKELDGSYMPSQRRFMLETASIAGGATIAIVAAFIFGFIMYLKWHRNEKQKAAAAAALESPPSSASATDHVDGISYIHHPHNNRHYHHHSPIFGVFHQHSTQERQQRHLASPIPIIHSHINNNHRRPPDYEHQQISQLGNNNFNINTGSSPYEPNVVVPVEIDDSRDGRGGEEGGGGRNESSSNDNLNRPNVPLQPVPPLPPQDRGDNTTTILFRGAPPWAV